MANEIEEVPERDPWEQMDKEPQRWFNLFNDFRLLGPNRTLRKLYRNKREQRGMPDIPQNYGAPSNWAHYYRDWRWKERAEAWDEVVREKQEDDTVDVLGSGLALAHNRIVKLVELADRIEGILLDPKAKISPYLVEQYRGILDDIAKEKGERSKEVRLTGTKGGPVVIETSWGRGGSASDAWETKQISAPSDAIEGVVVSEDKISSLGSFSAEIDWPTSNGHGG